MPNQLFAINKSNLLKYSNNIEDLAQDLVELFWQDDTQNEILFVKENVNNPEKLNDVLNTIHKVKTSIAMVGLSNFYEEVDSSYRDLQSQRDIDQNIEKLTNMFNQFVENREEIQEEYKTIF